MKLILDDTLTSIAVQYSTTVHQLKRTNKMFLTSNEVEPGKLSYSSRPSCPSRPLDPGSHNVFKLRSDIKNSNIQW